MKLVSFVQTVIAYNDFFNQAGFAEGICHQIPLFNLIQHTGRGILIQSYHTVKISKVSYYWTRVSGSTMRSDVSVLSRFKKKKSKAPMMKIIITQSQKLLFLLGCTLKSAI